MKGKEHKEKLMSDGDNDRKVEIISDGDWEVECKDAVFQVSEDAITAAGAQVLVERAAPPDDTSFTFYHDATSTRIFLNIIHHKSHSVPLDLGPRELHGVGLIASQAGCVSILGGYGRAWLYRAMQKRTSLNEIAGFLLCADLFELDDMYSDISQSLVCRNAEEFKKSETESDNLNYWLAESFLNELESNRKKLALRTEIALMALLGKLNKCGHGAAQKFARTYFMTLVRSSLNSRRPLTIRQESVLRRATVTYAIAGHLNNLPI
ncbi:uncharacterized protein APUU_10115S [Aspergillus puulaauensis]|uniref:BTB domain-containing protein n=1 Tax=Aspergillus puulaauensis TaxID=1220207 RepID=A0A7R7X9E6_9EURO|nr:uncharacterized protein APUU_10115S [Aspergillus puulaauensis]BCS17287.1 hypothetical protein APUU_10115S [Aspergillus puulaauensis]